MRRLGSFLFTFALLGVGFLVGRFSVLPVERLYGVAGIDVELPEKVDFSPVWATWTALNDKFVPADVSSTSLERANLFTQDMVWGAATGLAGALGDPYTAFFPPKETEIFKSEISGNFDGVGMEIGITDEVLTVVAPLEGSPAKKAGILAGDKILEIDGVTTTGLRVDEAVSKIRGRRGTVVALTILRTSEGIPRKLSITRAVIDLPIVKTEEISDDRGNVFIIRLYAFSETSPGLFRDALQRFVNTGDNKLIIDLRSNPGGYLEAAVDMASWFLPEGKPVVREYFGKSKPELVHRSKGYDIFNDNLKLVILVDGGSASASEILAGALREHDKAVLVGTKTFGKGSVQELVEIGGGTSLKVTVARWLTPLGESISQKGLEPDYKVNVTEEDIKNKFDAAQFKALELIHTI